MGPHELAADILLSAVFVFGLLLAVVLVLILLDVALRWLLTPEQIERLADRIFR